jgi:hypothetical protein
MMRLVVFLLAVTAVCGQLSQFKEMKPLKANIKPAKESYAKSAAVALPKGCASGDMFDYVLYCHKLLGEGGKLPDQKDQKEKIDCTKAPKGFDDCKKAIEDIQKAPGPSKEESQKAIVQGEGHFYKDSPTPVSFTSAGSGSGSGSGGNKAKFAQKRGRGRARPSKVMAPSMAEVEAAVSSGTHLPLGGALWSHRTISYCFNANAGVMHIARFLEGMQLISSKTVIRFKHAACDAAGHKLELTQVNGFANSYVGCTQGGGISAYSARGVKPAPASTSQPINYDPAVFDLAAAAHEVIHAIGFAHAHQSSDRATFVDILNPVANGHPNYDWCNNNVFAIWAGAALHGKYDYNSIMHYPQFTSGTCGTAGGDMFAQPNPAPAGKLYAGNGGAIGPGNDLTAEDVIAIDSGYHGVGLE